MTLLQPLGNNQIKWPADRVVANITKDAFRAGVPKANDAVAVGGNDCLLRSSE
jgi:hypothetical protein